jgi:predicted dehydrogenase
MKLPGIAVAGCGYWGQNLVRNFHALGALRMVCDPSESGRLRAYGIAPEVEVVESFDAVCGRSEIQAIVIATPAETHYPLALRALSAGKDVLVEKPLALNVKNGSELEAKAKDMACILMVGHLLEYHPAILKLRELIAQEILGKVNYIYSNRLNFGKIRTEENALWSFALSDIAIIPALGRRTAFGDNLRWWHCSTPNPLM